MVFETWNLCEEKLKEINQSLFNNYKDIDLLSLSRGQLGISLYFYNYYKYTSNEPCFNVSQDILAHSCTLVTERSNSPKLFKELTDLGKYILLLYTEKQVDDDIIVLLDEIDEILSPFAFAKLEKNDIDPVVGAISVGYYFLEKFKVFNDYSSKKILLAIVEKIKNLAIFSDNSQAFWTNNFRAPNNIELGISHGVSGILLFMTRLYEARIIDDKKLMCMGVNFLFSQQKDVNKHNCFFPQDGSKQENFLKIINLAYGDIGVAYSIYEVCKAVENIDAKKAAINILLFYARAENRLIYHAYDANLLYGSAGLAAFFKKLFTETNERVFDEAAFYWLNKTLSLLSENKNKYAGFVPYWNSIYPETHTSISEGISGIGLALLYFKNPLFNSFFSIINYN